MHIGTEMMDSFSCTPLGDGAYYLTVHSTRISGVLQYDLFHYGDWPFAAMTDTSKHAIIKNDQCASETK